MSHTPTSDLFAPPRLVISSLSGGGGKTLLSLGLTRALRQRGIRVKPYKKGPDYIDAAWLGLAAGWASTWGQTGQMGQTGPFAQNSLNEQNNQAGPDLFAGLAPTNLDPFFLDDERLRALFKESFGAADFALIEGNRGLYDGRDLEGSCSTARLARALDAPVVLVLNGSKMTRTAAAIVAGLASFEPVRLAGVVLNRMGSPRHSLGMQRAIEHYCGIPVLGAIPRLPENLLPERHMGLCSIHDEALIRSGFGRSDSGDSGSGNSGSGNSDSGGSGPNASAEAALDQVAAEIAKHCDIDALLALGRSAPALPASAPFWPPVAALPLERKNKGKPRIGFVRDAALWFYYEENFEALRRAGAELIEVSLLSDAPWPALDGLYLGGGFPEMLAERLAASPHLADIRRLSEEMRPIYAECGGFMLLCRSLRVNGQDHPMADIFPASAEFCTKPQGLGYVEALVVAENPFHPLGARIRGHEFHYSRCTSLGENRTTLRLDPGVGMGSVPAGKGLDAEGGQKRGQRMGQDGLLIRNTFAAYTHIFAPAVPHWAPAFVQACQEKS